MNAEQIKNVAEHYSTRLVRRRRHDDSTYVTFRDPSSTTDDLGLTAHKAVDGPDPRFPDDWVFERLAVALDALVDADGDVEAARDSISDTEPFMYYEDAFRWIGKNTYNQALVEEVAEEYGTDFGHSFSGNVTAIANVAAANATVRIMNAFVGFIDN